MKRLSLVVTVILIFALNAFAQDVKPAVGTGSKSLNFTFDGLGTFGLNGTGPWGGLGVSYFLDENTAVRIGWQVGYKDSTILYTNIGSGTDGGKSDLMLGFGGDYLMYMNGATSRVRPYMGAGIEMVFSSTNYTYAISSSAGTGVPTEIKSGSLSLNLHAVAGAEFFIYPELSLSAEYGLNLFDYQKNKNTEYLYKNVSSVTVKNGSTITILGFGAAGATLHIYF